MKKFERKFIPGRDYEVIPKNGKFDVKDVTDIYPSDSCLAGQVIVRWVNTYDSLEEVKELFPTADLSHPLLATRNSFNHLDG